MPGASPYRRGTVGERLARAHLESMGWYVTRAYLSRGAWDLLALMRGAPGLMVQVKTGERGYMLPDDRMALIALAHRTGCKPILCHVPRPYASTFDGISYRVLLNMSDPVCIEPGELWGAP